MGWGRRKALSLYYGFVYSDIIGVDLAKAQFHSLSNPLASWPLPPLFVSVKVWWGTKQERRTERPAPHYRVTLLGRLELTRVWGWTASKGRPHLGPVPPGESASFSPPSIVLEWVLGIWNLGSWVIIARGLSGQQTSALPRLNHKEPNLAKTGQAHLKLPQ